MRPINCIVYTHHEPLAREIDAYVQNQFRVREFSDVAKFERNLRQTHHALVILDLRSKHSLELCRTLVDSHDNFEIIALGEPSTDPMLEVNKLGIYACEPLPLVRTTFQQVVKRAGQQLNLQLENNSLREQVQRKETQPNLSSQPPLNSETPVGMPMSLGAFSRSLRHIQNLQSLMENIVEGVASASLVARVGLFAHDRENPNFRYFTGLRCLEEARDASYDRDHPLVRWLEIHACQIARSHLEHIEDYNERMMLLQELDTLGAEIILPLQGRTKLLGWLFVGQRGTGLPFSYQDMEQLLLIAEHVSTTLENAFLYEESAIQRSLCETLLHSVPTGIVSINTEGQIKSMNYAAEHCLNLNAGEALHQEVSCLGSRLADSLLRAIHDEITVEIEEWIDPRSKRHLEVAAARLMNDDTCLGAVAFIHDVTEKRAIEEKQEQLERTSFWHDLAASMSHEIRNPLVAIKTYAQLLPERYEDTEFRSEFSDIVTEEVDRLNRIIEQINDFAHPPDLQIKLIEIPQLLQRGIGKALEKETYTDVPIHTVMEPNMPAIKGDPKALSECFANLITNALEATCDQGTPQIELKARQNRHHDGSQDVVVTVSDNGSGIPFEFQDKIFSPFCTSKPRGMGLGLPIAKRTIIDHNGSINIDSAPEGTHVVISLPAFQHESASA